MKTGDIVRYASPQDGEESILFIVLESFEDAQPPRVKVRLIDESFSISPVSIYSPDDLKVVDGIDNRPVWESAQTKQEHN